MLSQFYLLFLFALPSHSFLTQCSNITKIYEIDANIQKPYILRGGENSIWSFREPHGGNLTLEFLSEVKLSTEVCLNTIKNPPRIFVEISGATIPFCQGRFVYYPLASGNAITVKLCDLELDSKINVLITPKIAGNVFAQKTLTQNVIKPKKYKQWIRVRKTSSDKQSLAVELQQITFRNSMCTDSFITIQKISQDTQKETIQVICVESNVSSLHQFTFASNIKSVNLTFQNVGFQLVYQLKSITLDGRKKDDIDVEDESSNFPIYLPIVLGGVLLCVIVVVIFFIRRRRSKNKQENQAPTNTTHEYDCDDYVGLESTRSKFQFHEVPFSRGALISQSDRAPCPMPRAKNASYSQVPTENDNNQKNTPVGYATVDDFLLPPQKPRDHSRLEPPKILSTSYDAVCDEASGSSRNANVEYASIKKHNKKKPNISSQPNLLVNNLKSSKPAKMRKASLDLLQPQTSYYMSPRPSDPDLQTFASVTRLNPNMSRVGLDNRFISSTSNISLPTTYYDSPRPSIDAASIDMQKRIFSKHSVDL